MVPDFVSLSYRGFLLLVVVLCLQVWGSMLLGLDQTLTKGSLVRQSKSHEPDENVVITATYIDTSGSVHICKVNSKDLSSSWVWGDYVDVNYARPKGGQEQDGGSPHQVIRESQQGDQPSIEHDIPARPLSSDQLLRKERKAKRTAELIHMDSDAEVFMQYEAIDHCYSVGDRYSVWRRQYQDPSSDSTLKLMRDQIIMAKVYASIARSKNQSDLNDSLTRHIRENQRAIGAATSDDKLHPRSPEHVSAMGHVLSITKYMLYDCRVVARKLRVLLQSSEESMDAMKKKVLFLTDLATKTVPKPLHCLSLQLTIDYFLHDLRGKELADKEKLDNPSLYHYAIFSDNVLATSVVVNSTIVNAKRPEDHVFHIVTDQRNYAAMRMWFILNPPRSATINVENVDEFKWLNSSYSSVLRQLESSRLKDYYFKPNHPSSISSGDENLKYKNPKYLSILNHLRFYMPELYPKLDKILFLDDDVVVQKDLTQLWSINMEGMVNGAVETCGKDFHRFDKYLNFSNPMIAKNFDPRACGWAFGMNIFDLKEWKKHNITGIYHHWQDLNEDRTLWKLGSLPPGLLTFYNLTYVLHRSWHLLKLGYDPQVKPSAITTAAVIHYNGNYKPWLDLAISSYKPFWLKYVPTDDPYFQTCNISLQ